MAAHYVSYAGCWSATKRTARSRTAAENGFDVRVLTPVLFVMLPISQRWESPPNPGRFTLWNSRGSNVLSVAPQQPKLRSGVSRLDFLRVRSAEHRSPITLLENDTSTYVDDWK